MATNAHTEHPGGGKPQFPPFNKETFASQLVWFVIFFVALYVLIGRFAIPRIGGIIEARRSRVEGDLAEANRLKEQSDAALKVFASFIPLLAGLGIIGWAGATLPLGMVVALTALELLVAFLQAYVFAILTCIYLNDAIHPGH